MGGRDGERRRGFTLVEMMSVVLISGTLARVAVPNYQEMHLKARAAEVAGEIRTVEVAVLNYNADTNRWPTDVTAGVVPPELRSYLPAGFRFTREGYRLDWENWKLPDGLPRYPRKKVLLGVSVTSENETLLNAVSDLTGGSRARFTLGDTYTFVLEGP